MAKGRAAALLIMLGLLILAGTALFFMRQQSVLQPDDWILYDDFSVPDATIVNAQKIVSSGAAGDANVALPEGCVFKGSGRGTTSINGEFVCSSDKWVVSLPVRYKNLVGVLISEIKYSGDSISLTRACGAVGFSNPECVGSAAIRSAKTFDGHDLKATVTSGGGSGGTYNGIGLSGGAGGAVNCPLCGTGLPSETSFESSRQTRDLFVFSSKLNTSYQEGVGGTTNSFGSSSRPKYIEIGGVGLVDAVYYRLPFNCNVGAGELLVYELMPAGKTISIFSFQHGVRRFCFEHPVVILKEGVGSTTTSEPLARWVRGETLTVPEGQDWGVFYVAGNDGMFPACGTDEVFSTESDKCRKLTGLAVSCSSGLFDTVTGECVVGNLVLCPNGGRYTINQDGSKSCDYLLPTNYVCEDPDAVAFPALGKCIITLVTEPVCNEKGGTYNPSTRACEWFPLKVIKCLDPLAAYNSKTDTCEKIVKTNLENDCAKISGGKGVFTAPDTCLIQTKVVEEKVVEVRVNQTLVTIPDVADCLKKGGQAVEKEGRVICRTPVPGEEQLFCASGEPNAETGKCVVRGDVTVLPVYKTSPVLIGLSVVGVLALLAGIVLGGIKLLRR